MIMNNDKCYCKGKLYLHSDLSNIPFCKTSRIYFVKTRDKNQQHVNINYKAFWSNGFKAYKVTKVYFCLSTSNFEHLCYRK